MAKRKQMLAKLTPPTLPKVLERTRLFRHLDRATKAPLTWIAAPPGAGKTTLLASYLKKRRRPILWYRLDAGDTDPSTFFHYLGLAVQTASPRFRKQLPHLTPEYFAGLPIFTQRFFEALGDRFQRPALLVFDNYQEVPLESGLHQLLPIGIQQLPPHIRVVIVSREAYPQGYIRMAANQQLLTIPSEEFTLTRTEARAVYELHATRMKHLSKTKSIDYLWEVVRGWMAGFILLLERGGWRETVGDLNLQGNPQALFDYLAGEVMSGLPIDTQQLLTTMSLVPNFTPNMAVALTANSEAGHILERLHRSRYFIERREDRHGWFRYHPLFNQFLLRRAEQIWDPKELSNLRRKAAALLIESHYVEDAVALLQQAQAWEDYRVIIRAQAPTLVQQGRIQTLETWIRQLPDAQREVDPWMDFWVANGYLFRAPEEAYRLYGSAIQRFRQQEEQAGMLLAWAGAVQSILVVWTGNKRIHDLVCFFDEIHPTGRPYPSVEVEAVIAQAMAGAYFHMYPDRLKAREWLDRSAEIAHALPPSMRVTAIMTAVYHIWLSDGKRAHAVFADQQRLWADDASVSMRVMMAVNEATLSLWAGQVEQCRDLVQAGLNLAEREGLLAWNGFLYSQGATNELMIGNVAHAREFLKGMRSISVAMGGLHYFHYLGLEFWADLMEGVDDTVTEKIRLCQEILEHEGVPLMTASYTILEAQYVYRKGKIDEAQRLLETVELTGRAVSSKQLLTGVFMLRAEWAFDSGDDQAGEMLLLKGIMYARQTLLMGFIGWQPASMARLLAKALERGIEVPYVLEVIRKRQLKPPVDGSAPESWPWRVKIRTFGKLAVEVDGRPLEKQRKAPHRLLELLVAIVAFGGHDIPMSRLIDALWPEADGDQAQENFKKSIARLRKLLAVEDVILWQESKISLNPDLCWVDVLMFEKQAKREDGRAIPLYKGSFLGHDEIPAWAELQRDQVRTKFICLIDRHCDQAQSAGKVEEAIHSLERAIDAEPLAEPLYHRLIPLLVAQGRQADARRYYQACVKAYQRWGNGDLSSETLRLGQSLTH